MNGHMKMDLKGFTELQTKLAFLKTAEGNKVIRQGLRASIPPVRRVVKSELMKVRKTSKQSTGATLRALIRKVSYPSRKYKGRGYALTGIDYHYLESHMKHTKEDRRKAGLKRSPNRLYGVRVGTKGKKSKIVRSYQTSSARIYRTKGHRSQFNRPAKYWHMINDGVRTFQGYHFVRDAVSTAGDASVNTFMKNVVSGLKRKGL